MASLLKRRDTDMTQGGIIRLLVAFALPLLIGNLFQQLYNTVDSIIVGNYVGKQALAAVGCTSSITNMLIGLFIGLSAGAGVVISQYYGAHDDELLRRAVSSTVCMTLGMCVVVTALGVTLTPTLLRLMETPDDVFDAACLYLRIYFAGVSGLLFYNIGAGILRAVGDSTHPLYFLIFSAVTNTLLDLLFVKSFSLGIAGAAYATILSQAISAVLVMAMLGRSEGAYRVDWRALRVDAPVLRRIFAIGIPSSVQMAITGFSNIFVQSYVNRFGSSAMAGWAAYNRIDAFAMLPLLSLSMAITTFVGQNLGADRMDRVRKGPFRCLLLAWGITAVILIPLMVFAPFLVGLFNGEADVVRYGSFFIRLISPFYLLCAINQVYSGALRGAGDTKAAMAIMLFSFVAFRQLYLFLVYRLGGGIVWISLGYPSGWIMCSLIMILYYYFGSWPKRCGLKKAQEQA